MTDTHKLIIGAAVYLAFISLTAAVLTVYDKRQAKSHGRRVPERTLLLVALLGGSVAEWLPMRTVRHKTLHKKFMIGLPAMMVFQLLLIGTAVYFRYFR